MNEKDKEIEEALEVLENGFEAIESNLILTVEQFMDCKFVRFVDLGFSV